MQQRFSYLAVVVFSVCASVCVNIAHWTGLLNDYEYEYFCDIDRFNDAVSSLMDENVTQKRQYSASVADFLQGPDCRCQSACIKI